MNTTLVVFWRQDMPVHCGGCGHRWVPEDGPVMGIDERFPDELWPVVQCPDCGDTVAAGPAHVRRAVLR